MGSRDAFASMAGPAKAVLQAQMPFDQHFLRV